MKTIEEIYNTAVCCMFTH